MKYIKYYLLFLLALLPVFLLRDFTPDNELRYLSIADEAIRNGTFFTFTNHGAIYADKPPLYLWVVMAGKALFGHHALWFLGLFSLIPAFVIMGVMDRWCVGQVAGGNRFAAQMMLFTSVFFIGSAVVLRMDMLMCMFIVLALRVFFRMYEGKGHRGDRFLFPFYVFMALFTKGPVGLLVPLLASVVFLLLMRRWRDIGRYWGWRSWSVLLAGCALWFGGVLWEGGTEYLNNLLFHQTIDRAVDAFHHKEPFYYYLVVVWYAIAPWSLLIIGAILFGIWKRMIRTDLEKFFLTVIGTTFVMLSLISSKIQIYLLPAFPFMVFLAAMLLSKMCRNALFTVAIAIPCGVQALVLPVAAVLAFRPEFAGMVSFPVWLGAAILTVTGGVALFLLLARGAGSRAVVTASAGLIAAVFAASFAVPSFNPQIGYGTLCAEGKRIAEMYGTESYRFYGVRRGENMDAYLHVPVLEISEEELLEGKGKGSLLFVRNRAVESPALQQWMQNKTAFPDEKYTMLVIE